jgi:lipoprotein-anchoring transpeptidase ErfK/SrfK
VQRARTAFSLLVMAVASAVVLRTAPGQPAAAGRFHVQSVKETHFQEFSEEQIAVLEKVNRADRVHLRRLPTVVVPDVWSRDETAYSPFPSLYESASSAPKALVVMIDIQAFAAYERGQLMRWGPVSTGARGRETTPGRLSLNWKSRGRHSTVNPDWYMPWYFNIRNEQGVAFHAYALPGRPASHGCIRLLERDAVWLFSWGEEWRLEKGRVRAPGTPVLIVGRYDFDAPPPWTDVTTLGRVVALPEFPFEDD